MCALEHPTYTSPTLHAILTSRLAKLQNCADAYPFVEGQCHKPEDSVTIDGVNFDITTQQKDIAEKLSKEAQLDLTEAVRIVLQQSKVGIVELGGIIRGYMEERTALLRVVKSLFRMDAHRNTNGKIGSIAKGISDKVKEDEDFLPNLVRGIKKRTKQELPHTATSDEASSFLWSRQV